MKSKLIFVLCILFFAKSIAGFVTIWKPSNPSSTIPNYTLSSNTQIYFPGIGTNYTINWEEVGYTSHNGIISNITTSEGNPKLINFGTSYNPNPANATYKVTVTGTGFNQFKSGNEIDTYNGKYYGDVLKLISIEQWGEINWSSMNCAFIDCKNMDMKATDSPLLNNCTDLFSIFSGCVNLVGNSSFNSWNTSTITNLGWAFYHCNLNQDLNNWNTSNVTNMNHMFCMTNNFNGNISTWDTSKVTNMAFMFNGATAFNQPIGNWNTSQVTEIGFMFSYASVFNQPIGNWNTSKVTDFTAMFSNSHFNQPLNNWNTSNAVYLMGIFYNASAFNQDIGNWDLSKLQFASNMLSGSGVDCKNYDKTLIGWANNPNTPNNIPMENNGMIYSSTTAVAARNVLISKGWSFTGDIYDASCNLGIGEVDNVNFEIYPNPVKDFLHIKTSKKIQDIKIFSSDGREILQPKISDNSINVNFLPKGNYLLQLTIDDRVLMRKFIKK